MKKENCRAAAVTAFSFGFFQAAMPLTGWLIGRRFQSLITDIDHWVAFLLLAFLGVKMMKDAFSEKTCCPAPGGTDLKELLALSVATSIDALAVGITFAFLQVPILSSSLLIGLVTFSLSFAGVMLGSRFGTKHRFGAQMAGGGHPDPDRLKYSRGTPFRRINRAPGQSEKALSAKVPLYFFGKIPMISGKKKKAE